MPPSHPVLACLASAQGPVGVALERWRSWASSWPTRRAQSSCSLPGMVSLRALLATCTEKALGGRRERVEAEMKQQDALAEQLVERLALALVPTSLPLSALPHSNRRKGVQDEGNGRELCWIRARIRDAQERLPQGPFPFSLS